MGEKVGEKEDKMCMLVGQAEPARGSMWVYRHPELLTALREAQSVSPLAANATVLPSPPHPLDLSVNPCALLFDSLAPVPSPFLCSDPLACSFANQRINLTLATRSTDTYLCTAADVVDATKLAFIRNQLVPAAVEL